LDNKVFDIIDPRCDHEVYCDVIQTISISWLFASYLPC